MAGRTRTARVFDESGGRRHRNYVVPDGRAGNDLGRRRSLERLDGEVWSAAGAVYGLEKRVREGADAKRNIARNARPDAVWADVPSAGNQNHRGQFAAGQGPCGAQSRHASGPAGGKTAAPADRHARGSEPGTGG